MLLIVFGWSVNEFYRPLNAVLDLYVSNLSFSYLMKLIMLKSQQSLESCYASNAFNKTLKALLCVVVQKI